MKNWNEIFWDTLFTTVGKLMPIAKKQGYDFAGFTEKIQVEIAKNISDALHFSSHWRIDRCWEKDFIQLTKNLWVPKIFKPYDVSFFHGNLALNEGINLFFSLICGGAGVSYANATAQLGVGNSSAAVVATQTDLQGGATVEWVGMDGGFPTYGASQTLVAKSTFTGTLGNFAWEEYSLRNSVGANINANRKLSTQGTKVNGQIWILTQTLTGA